MRGFFLYFGGENGITKMASIFFNYWYYGKSDGTFESTHHKNLNIEKNRKYGDASKDMTF